MDYDISDIGQRIPAIQRRIDDKLSNQQKLQAEISKFASKNAELVDKKHEGDMRYAQHLQQNQLHEKSISLLDEKIASIEAKVVSLFASFLQFLYSRFCRRKRRRLSRNWTPK